MNMSTTIQNLANNRQLVKVLGLTTITSLSFLGGISCCLSTWIIPLLRRSQSPSTAIAQFQLMIEKGFRYLQTSSRILGAALASLTFLAYSSQDSKIASQFKYWAAALAMLVPLAPYEIYFIFPSNYRIDDMGKALRKRENDELTAQEKVEFEGLLTRWQWRNGVRFLTPVIAGVIGTVGMFASEM
jgi:hypothetical protein